MPVHRKDHIHIEKRMVLASLQIKLWSHRAFGGNFSVSEKTANHREVVEVLVVGFIKLATI